MRVYNQEIDTLVDYCIFPIDVWENEIKNITCLKEDGHGYYIKDSLISNDEVFSFEKQDATHIVWYNKSYYYE